MNWKYSKIAIPPWQWDMAGRPIQHARQFCVDNWDGKITGPGYFGTYICRFCHSRTQYPEYTYVLGFLPRNHGIWGLEHASKYENCPIIKAGEEKKLWFTATAITF